MWAPNYLLAFLAFALTLVSAVASGRVPLWIPVLLIAIVLMLR